MPLVLICLHDQRHADVLTRCLERQVRVEVSTTPRELVRGLRRLPVTAVVVGLRDAFGRSTAPLIDALRRRHMELPIVGVIGVSPGDLHDLVRAVRAGLSDVFHLGAEDVWAVLRPVLEEGSLSYATNEVLAALAPRAQGCVWPVLEYSVLHASSGPGVDQLALALGITRKTLSRRLHRAGLPSPSAVLSYCRLLIAARLLENPTFSVRRTADEFGYPTTVALRRAMKQRTGLRPSELRRSGGLMAILALLTAQPDRRCAGT